MTDDCDCPSGAHNLHCGLALMKITKEAFVIAAEGGVKAAFEAYKILVGMGYTDKNAQAIVIEEAEESASCFAGIGSCGSGGCKH